MAAVPAPDDREQIRAMVAARYASLARAAQAGQPVNDCDPAEFAAAASARPGTRTPAACPKARSR